MVDRYTKTILTVIAACLVWVVVRDVTLVKPAHAYDSVQSVNIAELGGMTLSALAVGERSPRLPVKLD